ncbi:hypothetical protein P7K49_007249 [Saguinus oedipus]|uniref:Uncharacterized protein n=1 Tax=Saguinus oedipus TaxID=9490 RepID=A0ABQ9VUC3_SAGOE|nr:hypothetical protein P7K49_007249 [Saguinus oedipus]
MLARKSSLRTLQLVPPIPKPSSQTSKRSHLFGGEKAVERKLLQRPECSSETNGKQGLPDCLRHAASDFLKEDEGREGRLGRNQQEPREEAAEEKTADAKLSAEKECEALTELEEVNKSPSLSCKQSL